MPQRAEHASRADPIKPNYARTEQAAFAFKDNVIWLAYHRFGGNKPETLYCAGWRTPKLTQESCATLVAVLASYFEPKHALDHVEFLSCTKVFLAESLPDGIKATMTAFFERLGLDQVWLEPKKQRPVEQLKQRWDKPFGEPLPDAGEEAEGYFAAISALMDGMESCT